MSKRINYDRVKKWMKSYGLALVPMIGLIGFMIFLNVITVLNYSGDQVCAGTLIDPCIAKITFMAKEDVFIYPNESWGLTTNKPIQKATLYRSWGNGWRKIDLNKSCQFTWCGAKRGSINNKFSYAFRKGKIYTLKYEVLKESPFDDVKWWVDELSVPDPVWIGVNYDDKYYENPVLNCNLIKNTEYVNYSFDCDGKYVSYVTEDLVNYNNDSYNVLENVTHYKWVNVSINFWKQQNNYSSPKISLPIRKLKDRGVELSNVTIYGWTGNESVMNVSDYYYYYYFSDTIFIPELLNGDVWKIGWNSTIINFTTSNGLSNDNVNDVFIYDLTKDSLDYTTWFNDSSKSWLQPDYFNYLMSSAWKGNLKTSFSYYSGNRIDEDWESPKIDFNNTLLNPTGVCYGYQVLPDTNPITGDLWFGCADDSSSPWNIHLYVINSDGKPKFNKSKIMSVNEGNYNGVITNCYPNGNCVVSFQDDNVDKSYMVWFDKNGNKLTDTIEGYTRVQSYYTFDLCPVDDKMVRFFSDQNNYVSFEVYDSLGNLISGPTVVDDGDTDLRMGKCGGFKDGSGNIAFSEQRSGDWGDWLSIYNWNGTQIKAPFKYTGGGSYKRVGTLLGIPDTNELMATWDYENNEGYFNVFNSTGDEIKPTTLLLNTGSRYVIYNSILRKGEVFSFNTLKPPYYSVTNYNDNYNIIENTIQMPNSANNQGVRTSSRAIDSGINIFTEVQIGSTYYYDHYQSMYKAGKWNLSNGANLTKDSARTGIYGLNLTPLGSATLWNPINVKDKFVVSWYGKVLGGNIKLQYLNNLGSWIDASTTNSNTWTKMFSTFTTELHENFSLRFITDSGVNYAYVDDVSIGSNIPMMNLSDQYLSPKKTYTYNLSDYTIDNDNSYQTLIWNVQSENESFVNCSISNEILTLKNNLEHGNSGYCVINVTDGENSNYDYFLVYSMKPNFPKKSALIATDLGLDIIDLENESNPVLWMRNTTSVPLKQVLAKNGEIYVDNNNNFLNWSFRDDVYSGLLNREDNVWFRTGAFYWINSTGFCVNNSDLNFGFGCENFTHLLGAQSIVGNANNIFVGNGSGVWVYYANNFTLQKNYTNTTFAGNSNNVTALDLRGNYLFVGTVGNFSGVSMIDTSTNVLSDNLTNYNISSLSADSLSAGILLAGTVSNGSLVWNFSGQIPVSDTLFLNLSDWNDLIMYEDTYNDTLNLTNHTSYNGSNNLVYSCVSNTSLLNVSVFVPDMLNITPMINWFGTGNVSCNVSDGNLVSDDSFIVNVLGVNDFLNISLYPLTKLFFPANLSMFNWTTFTLTDYNVSAENQSSVGALFNLSFTPEANGTLWMNTTPLDDSIRLWCGVGNDVNRSTAVLINGSTNITKNVKEHMNLSCWGDWINASQGYDWNYTINFSEVVVT